MSIGSVVIVLILLVIVFFAVKSSVSHFKGDGGCCGGGGGTLPDYKELDGAKIGEMKVFIDGMHCENCKNRVERAINGIDGAVAHVDLKKKVAVVSYDRAIDAEQVKAAVENAGYTVTGTEA